MTRLKTVVIAAAIIALVACGTQPIKPSEPVGSMDYSPELVHRVKGIHALEQWRETEDVQALFTAEKHLGAALKMQPDDIRLQQAYYSPMFTLAILDNAQWQARLENHFSVMHPLARIDLSPPAMVEFIRLEIVGADASEKREMLLRGVTQQPNASRVWLHLSEVLDKTDQHELSLMAAKAAKQIEPDAPEVAYRVASAYMDLVAQYSCPYSNTSLRPKALAELVHAVRGDPSNADYANALSALYVDLGILPLALSVAQKAQRLEDRADSIASLGNALYLSGRYDEASEQYTVLHDLYDPAWGADRLAAIFVANGHWAEARHHLAEAAGGLPLELYHATLDKWLFLLEGEGTAPPDFSRVAPADDWQRALVDFLRDDHAAPLTLVDSAKDTCQSTEAHFYAAMRWWQRGNLGKAQEQLQRVIDLKAFTFVEYEMAQALLKSGVFAL